jgi:TP901 family phage tail tape measure protein
MALNNLGLGFVFTARDLASGAIQNLERNFMSLDRRVGLGTERIQSAFQQLGVGLSVFTAGAATVGAAFSLANAAGRFGQAVAAVAAVSGASATELAQLRDAAIEAGMATQFSPTEATLGLRELAQAGFNAQESMQLLLPVLDLAGGSLGELSPQQAAGLAAQAMKAFGLSVDEASISVDRMLQSVNVFALNASELPLALGTASRGAQALHQSFSETLIALGLVKNVIPGVERASTAVAVAMERMADPEVQQRLLGMGVAVTDSAGRFRSFLDVLGEMAPRLDRMNEAQRSAFLLQTFGREALGGVNAILTQVTNGLRTSTGETLRGAEAIRYLRDQFENAGGTAARFREQMLDTFEGQKQLLAGSLETLAIVLGEPFAQIFKPLVTTFVDVVNALLGVFRQLPAPVKRALAAFTVGAGAIVALVGATISAKAGIALLAIGLKALGITAGGLIATLLPAILTVTLLGAAVAGFVHAFRSNLGGIADFARRLMSHVSLFFRGLMQLFEQGGFSGAVREELSRAESMGLKRFLISTYQVVYRLQQIWEGFKAGFTRSLEEARPVFEDLVNALSSLGEEVATLFGGITGTAISLPSSEFRNFGQSVGSALATVVSWGAQVIALSARVYAGFLSGFRAMQAFLAPAVDSVREAFAGLRRVWDNLIGATTSSTSAADKSTSAWRQLGELLGRVVGGALTLTVHALAVLIDTATVALGVVVALKDAFVIAGTWIGETAARLYLWFTETLPAAISSAWATLTGFFRSAGQFFLGAGQWFLGLFSSIADGLQAFFSPVVEFFSGVGRAIHAVFNALTDSVIRLLRKLPSELLPSSLEELARLPLSAEVQPATPLTLAAPGPAARAEVATWAMPAAADARSRAGSLAQLEQGLLALASPQAGRQGAAPPFTINVQVDGETIARATHRAEREAASRSFSPVPAY